MTFHFLRPPNAEQIDLAGFISLRFIGQANFISQGDIRLLPAPYAPQRGTQLVGALLTSGNLTFEAADRQKFPCLALAETCLHTGAAAPTVLNAANEVAVQAFLARQISFPAIAGVVEDALDRLDGRSAGGNLAEVVAIDAEAREIAEAATLRRAA